MCICRSTDTVTPTSQSPSAEEATAETPTDLSRRQEQAQLIQVALDTIIMLVEPECKKINSKEGLALSRPSAKAWWFLGGKRLLFWKPEGQREREREGERENKKVVNLELESGHCTRLWTCQASASHLGRHGASRGCCHQHKAPDRGLHLKGCRGPSSRSPTKPHEPVGRGCGSRSNLGMQWHKMLHEGSKAFMFRLAQRTRQ